GRVRRTSRVCPIALRALRRLVFLRVGQFAESTSLREICAFTRDNQQGGKLSSIGKRSSTPLAVESIRRQNAPSSLHSRMLARMRAGKARPYVVAFYFQRP